MFCYHGCHIEELLQQLTETCDQLAYIRKVLDHLVSSQTSAWPTPAVVTSTSTAWGSVPPSDSCSHVPRQVPLLSNIRFLQVGWTFQDIAHTNTASSSVPSSDSNSHLFGWEALTSSTGFPQAGRTFKDHAQTVAFQNHSNATFHNHSLGPIFSTSNIPLPRFLAMIGVPPQGQPLSFPQHLPLPTTTTTCLPGAHLPSVMENTTHGGCGDPGMSNSSALGTFPIYSTQRAPNTSSMG